MDTRVTFLAVSIAVHSGDEVPGALRRAERAVAGGARLVEWRVDGLAGQAEAASATAALLAGSAAPSIVTCRDEAEGGEYRGADEPRAALYETRRRCSAKGLRATSISSWRRGGAARRFASASAPPWPRAGAGATCSPR